MTNEELIKKLQECRALNERFETFFELELEPNASLKEWLDEVELDAGEDIIPEKIKSILSHNIDNLELARRIRYYQQIPSFPQEQYENDRIDLAAKGARYKETYHLYKSVGFVERNTVIVGANGSGKTSLANVLKDTLQIEDGIVIPAQKLLVVPTFDNIPTLRSEEASFIQYQKKVFDDKRTYSARTQDDFPYEMAKEYGSEYRKVLALLIAERNAKRNELIDSKEEGSAFKREDFKTTIDVVFDIWNDLIPHRTLYLNADCNLMIKYIDKESGEERSYDAYRMSDGERIILYHVGRVMQAPKNGLIIVDEPEMYLHRTVVDQLWNRLEKERQDCTFVYMTHDLHFATSRVGVKSWIKSYHSPDSWDIQVIEDNEIPEQLLLELLGSCKNILFCEGTATNSLDKKVFDILFPSFIIYPLESCREVISYTKAYNAIPNTNTKAFGLVDKDFRTPAEINNLKTNGVYTYQVAEVENLFLVEGFLKAFKEYHHWGGDVERVKSGIIDMFDKDKEAQCAYYVTSQIDYYYRMNHVSKGRTKAEVEKEVRQFNSSIKIDEWYNNRMRELELYVNKKSYGKVIAVYNNKGLHSVVEKEFGISNYSEKALEYLKIAPEEVLNALRLLFPSELASDHIG